MGNGIPGQNEVIKTSALNGPSGLMVANDELYIADRWNDRLIKMPPLEYGSYEFDYDVTIPDTLITEEIDVMIGDEPITFEDVRPMLEGEKVYYPIRVIAESLGAKVDYDVISKKATVEYRDKVYTYNIYDSNIRLWDDRSFIDIRLLASELGFFVTMGENNKDILISEILISE